MKRVLSYGGIFACGFALLTTPILLSRFQKLLPVADLRVLPLFFLNLGFILALVAVALTLDWAVRRRNWVNHFLNMIFDLLGDKTTWVGLILVAVIYGVVLKRVTTSPEITHFLVQIAQR